MSNPNGTAAATNSGNQLTTASPGGGQNSSSQTGFGEADSWAFQCYLLNAMLSITEEMNREYNNGGYYGGRLRRVRLERPETFFNNMGFPKSGEQLYKPGMIYNDASQFKWYLVKKFGGEYEKLDILESFARQTTSVRPFVSSLDVSFNGTDPASARSDIQVDIEITLPATLAVLDQTFDEAILHNGSRSYNDWKIIDLIVRPEFERNSEGLGRAERSQFHPEYNRCELVLQSRFHNPACEIENTVSFNLCMVDHEVNYSSTAAEGAVLKIKLSYYSYIQSFLNQPYMDVLGGKELLKKRQEAEDARIAALNGPCDDQSAHTQGVKARDADNIGPGYSKNRIVTALIEGNCVYTTAVSDGSLEKYRNKESHPAWDGDVMDSNANPKVLLLDDSRRDPDVENYANQDDGNHIQYVHFMTLGDIIAKLSDLFYQGEYFSGQVGSGPGYDQSFVNKLEIKFLTLDLVIKNSAGQDQYINISDIPISLAWFESFLMESYYKKNVTYAAFMSFLRSLIEKAVTQMLKKRCFSGKPFGGRVRVTSFRALKSSWNNIAGGSDYALPGSMSRMGQQMGALGRTEDDYYTYIIIHATSQNYRSALINSVTRGSSSQIEKEFPVLVDRAPINRPQNSEALQVYGTGIGTFFNFKKSDIPGMREARYFSRQSDEFFAIGNVYDCTVTFKSNLLNWFLPGHIVIINPYCGDSKSWKDRSSIGNRIGLTGFYVVTKVQHSFRSATSKFETVLNTMWMANTAGPYRKEGPCALNSDGGAAEDTPPNPFENSNIRIVNCDTPEPSSDGLTQEEINKFDSIILSAGKVE